MVRFSKKIIVDHVEKMFEFTKLENSHGVIFYIAATVSNHQPVTCGLKEIEKNAWKLVPGSQPWLHHIEKDLSLAITEWQ